MTLGDVSCELALVLIRALLMTKARVVKMDKHQSPRCILALQCNYFLLPGPGHERRCGFGVLKTASQTACQLDKQ